MEKMIHVGLGECRISSNPDCVLTCFGLGSCVAVTMYDPKKRIGGMVHIVLPTAHGKPTKSPARFGDTAIPLLWEKMKNLGADKEQLIVKVTGGAKILKLQHRVDDLDVGSRNIEMALEILKKLELPIQGQETGGTHGRTVRFYIKSGETFVRHRGEKQI